MQHDPDTYAINLEPGATPPSPRGDSSLTPMQTVMRRKWSILVFSLLTTAAAYATVRQLPARYTATAEVMIDAQQVRVITAENLLSSQMLDVALLRTEMERFNAPQLARSVVQQLGLTTVPEYCRSTQSTSGWYERLRGIFGRLTSNAPPSITPRAPCRVSVEKATRQLLGAVTASNDGRSYIINLNAEAGNPKLAALIANTYAGAFVAERRAERRAVVQDARRWMSSYVAQLRTQVDAADRAVAEYRAAHHLTQVRGQTVVSQTLGDLNSQLASVTGEIAQKQSTVAELRTVMQSGGDATATTPVLNSPLIQSLRVREAELAAQEAKLRARLGDAHPQVVAVMAQMRQLRQQVRAEVGKTVTSISGELVALKARRTALAARVNQLQTRVGEQGQTDVHLQMLERRAVFDRKTYQSMLGRLKEIEAQQGMEDAGARVVVTAMPPLAPSWPRTKMMTVGAFIAAFGIGASLAFVHSLLLRAFRDIEHVEQETGLPVLGVFARPRRRLAPQDMTLDTPGSPESEALRTVFLNTLYTHGGRRDHPGRTVLITSALPSEGKTSFAVAFGRAAARSGMSTVLLDCDMRRPAVKRLSCAGHGTLAADRAVDGRGGGLAGNSLIDKPSGMHVLSLSGTLPDPCRLIGSESVRALLQHLRTQYDIVLLDTPPLLVVADALSLVSLADDVVLVVNWHTTPRHAVVAAVRMLRRCGANLSGAVLSKINLRRYSGMSPGYTYYARRYLEGGDTSGAD